MALLQLPPELLLHVIGYLGPELFGQDIRRLTVSRTWYDFAWKVLVRNLRFTPQSLKRFIDDDAVLARSQPYVTTIQLYLGGHGVLNHSQPPLTGEPVPVSDDDEWAAELNSSLVKLAATLRRCPALRSLELKSRALDIQRRQYLTAQPLADLLSVRHLTSLVFDTASCHLNSPDGTHLCRSINTLLPSLRRLHCRMDMVCEALLELPPGDAPLALEEVIVNLSISQLSDTYTSYRHARPCHPSDILQLKEAMEKQATALAARMRKPWMVRVISYNLPSLDIYAFDAIRGRKVHLENNIDWDAEGEVVEETQSDDSEDDDSEDDDRDLFADDEPVTPFVHLSA